MPLLSELRLKVLLGTLRAGSMSIVTPELIRARRSVPQKTPGTPRNALAERRRLMASTMACSLALSRRMTLAESFRNIRSALFCLL